MYAIIHLVCSILFIGNSRIGIADFFQLLCYLPSLLSFYLIRLLSSGRQGELHFQGVLGTDLLSETGCVSFYHGVMIKFVRDS